MGHDEMTSLRLLEDDWLLASIIKKKGPERSAGANNSAGVQDLKSEGTDGCNVRRGNRLRGHL